MRIGTDKCPSKNATSCMRKCTDAYGESGWDYPRTIAPESVNFTLNNCKNLTKLGLAIDLDTMERIRYLSMELSYEPKRCVDDICKFLVETKTLKKLLFDVCI